MLIGQKKIKYNIESWGKCWYTWKKKLINYRTEVSFGIYIFLVLTFISLQWIFRFNQLSFGLNYNNGSSNTKQDTSAKELHQRQIYTSIKIKLNFYMANTEPHEAVLYPGNE